MKFILSLLLAAAVVSGSSSAQTWQLDKAHSQVTFSVAHLVIAEVSGRFTDFEVNYTQAKDDITSATIEAKIKTASIHTDNENRDKHLRSDDFLNAEKFPEMTFKSKSIEKVGDKEYRIHGDLTIRDVTKPVVLNATHAGDVTDPWGNVKRAFKATTKFNRFDYGVKWNTAIETGGLVAGETIYVSLAMQFMKK